MKKLVVECLGCLLLSGTNLGAAPKKEDVPDLIKALKTSKDAKVRAQAADDLGYIAQIRVAFAKPAIPALVEALKSDPDAGVRKAAADTLSLVNPDPKDVMALFLDILKNDKEPNIVLQAVAACLQIYPGETIKDALPHLLEIQKRESAKDEKVRDQNLLQTVAQCIRIITGK